VSAAATAAAGLEERKGSKRPRHTDNNINNSAGLKASSAFAAAAGAGSTSSASDSKIAADSSSEARSRLVPEQVRNLQQEVQQLLQLQQQQQQQQQDQQRQVDLSGVEVALEQLHIWLRQQPQHAQELALMPGSLASLAGLLQVCAAHAGHASSAHLAEDCLAVLHFICDNALTAQQQQQQQQQQDARALLLSAPGMVEAVAAVLIWARPTAGPLCTVPDVREPPQFSWQVALQIFMKRLSLTEQAGQHVCVQLC
jgi:outer membrane biogenesis lipoprotein LolB